MYFEGDTLALQNELPFWRMPVDLEVCVLVHKFWLLMNSKIKMYTEVTLEMQSMLLNNMWQPYAVRRDERRASFCYSYINSNHIL